MYVKKDKSREVQKDDENKDCKGSYYSGHEKV